MMHNLILTLVLLLPSLSWAVCSPSVLPRLGIVDCEFDGDCEDNWGPCVQNNLLTQDAYECRSRKTCWRVDISTPLISESIGVVSTAVIPNEGAGEFVPAIDHDSSSITVGNASSGTVSVVTGVGDNTLPNPTTICNVLDPEAGTATNTVHHIQSFFDSSGGMGAVVRVQNDDGSNAETSNVYCIMVGDSYDANATTTSTTTVTTTSSTTTTVTTTSSTTTTVTTTSSTTTTGGTTSSTVTTTTTSSTTTTVGAGASTMFAWVGTDAWPTNSGGLVAVQNSAQRMRCMDVIQGVGIDDATHWVVEVTTALDSSSSITIYSTAGGCPESGSCQIATTGPQNWASTGTFDVTTSAFDLTEGTEYRICWCATSSTNGAFRSVTDMGASQDVEDWFTSGARHIGLAPVANNCSSGNADTDTGTLEDTGGFRGHPIILLHTTP